MPDTSEPRTWRLRIKRLYHRFIALQGNPHYIAMGTAIGVFVGFTPTIPLHTAIGIGLAFLFKASKPAAAIAVWVANPVTIPFFYFAAFKLGTLILGHEVPLSETLPTVKQLIRMGWDVTVAMIVGGAILGIIPSIATYLFTFKLFQGIQTRRMLRIANRHQSADSKKG